MSALRRPSAPGICLRRNSECAGYDVDVAVGAAFQHDLIVDLIMAGADTEGARSALLPAKNQQDPAPFLRYIAARYSAYPNVWFCLINEVTEQGGSR